MSNVSKKMLMGAAGAAGGDPVTVDQVFSTYLYTGTGSSQNIVNDLDMSGEGGLTWLKSRSLGTWHHLFDTERGANKVLVSNETDGEVSQQYSSNLDSLNAFNSNGFTLGAGNQTNLQDVNQTGQNYVSWSWRKAPKFFTIVQFSGSGSGIKTVAHDLESAPALILLKKTSGSQDWLVFSKDTSQPHNKYLKLNSNVAEQNYDNIWGPNGYLPTATEFKVQHLANESASYIAYIFADNSSEDAADRMIRCGSYTSNSGGAIAVDLGFEPQWLLVKNTSSTANWAILDTMRGFSTDAANNLVLNANADYAEQDVDEAGAPQPTSTGFKLAAGNQYAEYNNGSDKIIYMAIRRDNQAEVTDATDVFNIATYTGDGTNRKEISTGFPADFVWGPYYTFSHTDTRKHVYDRLRGQGRRLNFNTTANEVDPSATTDDVSFDSSLGYAVGSSYSVVWNTSGISYQQYAFKRAKSFFDIVCYNGTGSDQDVPHALSVSPEIILTKYRGGSGKWNSFSAATGNYRLTLNETAAVDDSGYWGSMTATTFGLRATGSVTGTSSEDANKSGQNYIAYLFSSLDGISKCGSVVHSGTTNVNAGFSNGCRFLLIKRTDSTGAYMVFDSTRGIVSGNDPFIELNSSAAEETTVDWVDPYSAGFTLTSSLTAGTYMYLTIA